MLGGREFDHLQADAYRGRLLSRLRPGIALIDKGECDHLPGHRLDLAGDLYTILPTALPALSRAH